MIAQNTNGRIGKELQNIHASDHPYYFRATKSANKSIGNHFIAAILIQ